MAIEAGIEVTIDRVEEIMKQVNALTHTKVMVGIPSNTANRKEGKLTNAVIGYIHEHGSAIRNIPARPFLFPAVNSMQSDAAKFLQTAAEYYLNGELEKAQLIFDALGLKAQSVVKNKIVNGPFAPNSPATIKAKGSDRPLIDTGQLLNSITYVVRK